VRTLDGLGEEEVEDIVLAEIARLREVERLAARVVCLQGRVDRGLAEPFKRMEAIARLKEVLERR
tara:strand:- start:402 stop:596 length:195 start_codon:yes stop_codon:yes gene_type:complete